MPGLVISTCGCSSCKATITTISPILYRRKKTMETKVVFFFSLSSVARTLAIFISYLYHSKVKYSILLLFSSSDPSVNYRY